MTSNRSNPTFVVRRTGEDELQHWLKKGQKPKYIEKIPLGNGEFKYVYADDKKNSGTLVNKTKNMGQLKGTGRVANSSTNTLQGKMKADFVKKSTRDVRDYSQFNAQQNARAKEHSKNTVAGYKDATSVSNALRTLTGQKIKAGSNYTQKMASSNADTRKQTANAYRMGSTKKAAKKALKNHVKRAVNNTIKSAASAIEKGRNFLKDLFD